MSHYTVIIPQYGQQELTLKATESLLSSHPDVSVEVIIVDDGSPQATGCQFDPAWSKCVSLLKAKRRRGVTAAWNLGARCASGAILVFLNNDTVSAGPWIEQLTEPLRHGTCLLTGMGWRRETGSPVEQQNFLEGWCLAIRADTFASIGGFDERFRLYFSDTDLQLRLWHQQKDSLVAVQGLPLKHLGHRSTRTLTSRHEQWRNDQMQFYRKWSDQKGE